MRCRMKRSDRSLPDLRPKHPDAIQYAILRRLAIKQRVNLSQRVSDDTEDLGQTDREPRTEDSDETEGT